jgi:hypothetical protein
MSVNLLAGGVKRRKSLTDALMAMKLSIYEGLVASFFCTNCGFFCAIYYVFFYGSLEVALLEPESSP